MSRGLVWRTSGITHKTRPCPRLLPAPYTFRPTPFPSRRSCSSLLLFFTALVLNTYLLCSKPLCNYQLFLLRSYYDGQYLTPQTPQLPNYPIGAATMIDYYWPSDTRLDIPDASLYDNAPSHSLSGRSRAVTIPESQVNRYRVNDKHYYPRPQTRLTAIHPFRYNPPVSAEVGDPWNLYDSRSPYAPSAREHSRITAPTYSTTRSRSRPRSPSLVESTTRSRSRSRRPSLVDSTRCRSLSREPSLVNSTVVYSDGPAISCPDCSASFSGVYRRGNLRRHMRTQHTINNPHVPLLLSIDGGGVRGLSSLMALSKLMKNVALEEKQLGMRARNVHIPLKSCDDFDLAGTSTGGLIAIMLSRLRLNVKECSSAYIQLTEQIFKQGRTKLCGRASRVGHSQDKYHKNKHHCKAVDTEDTAEHRSHRTRVSRWNRGDCNCQAGHDHQNMVHHSRMMSAIAPDPITPERRQLWASKFSMATTAMQRC